MEEAAVYPGLSKLRLIGADSTSLSPNLTKSKKAADFAGKTKFTASIMSSPVFESYQSSSAVTDVIYHDLSVSLGRKVTAMYTNSYDAAWIFALMYASKDWKFSNIEEYKNALFAVTGRMIGVNGSVKFDDKGERIIGNIAFNRIISYDLVYK